MAAATTLTASTGSLQVSTAARHQPQVASDKEFLEAQELWREQVRDVAPPTLPVLAAAAFAPCSGGMSTIPLLCSSTR